MNPSIVRLERMKKLALRLILQAPTSSHLQQNNREAYDRINKVTEEKSQRAH